MLKRLNVYLLDISVLPCSSITSALLTTEACCSKSGLPYVISGCHYPGDKNAEVAVRSIRWIAVYPADKAIRFLSNWVLADLLSHNGNWSFVMKQVIVVTSESIKTIRIVTIYEKAFKWQHHKIFQKLVNPASFKQTVPTPPSFPVGAVRRR